MSVRRSRFYLAVAAVCLLVAGVLALFASSAPDGLERVAEDQGFADAAADSATASSPLADYDVAAGGTAASRAVAGVIGVAVTAGVAFAVFGALSMRTQRDRVDAVDAATSQQAR